MVVERKEILGWQTYASDLTARAMQASLEFGAEIEQACRWPSPLGWNGLNDAQRARSRQLMAILKSAFNAHPRTVTLINAYSEGVPVEFRSGNEPLATLPCRWLFCSVVDIHGAGASNSKEKSSKFQ